MLQTTPHTQKFDHLHEKDHFLKIKKKPIINIKELKFII